MKLTCSDGEFVMSVMGFAYSPSSNVELGTSYTTIVHSVDKCYDSM